MNRNFTNKQAMAAVAALVLAAAGPALAQGSSYQEGLHYFKIDQASAASPDGKIELIEAFSYMCPHCNTFEPYITKWLERKPENVKFKRVPVIFGRRSWELYARAYVTAEMIGIAEEAHAPLMDALWKDKKIMRNIEEIAEFYADFGVAPEEFVGTSRSFAVDARMRKDQRMTQDYGVNGTPSLIVNGKYLIKAGDAVQNFETMLKILDSLIAQETAAMSAAAAEQADTAAETEGR